MAVSELSESFFGIQNTTTLLKELLNRRGVDGPNGAPLYSYQLSELEYKQLCSVLRAGKLSRVSFNNTFWCALFCLFGAEWYRREYQSGWSWSGIFSALGYELDASQRADVVVKGLTYWRRPLNKYESKRNDYLGSLFSEGGLPFNLLSQQGSRFQALFKRLLAEFDRAKAIGKSPLPYIERQLERMPDAFKTESTVNLFHDMVSNLYGLIDTYELEEKDHPHQFLESNVPKWRLSFPIPLDTQTGNTFLIGLLRSAAEHRRELKRTKDRIKISQWLLVDEEIHVATKIELNDLLSLPIASGELTSPIVEIMISEGNAVVADFGIARATPRDGHVILNLRKSAAEFKRHSPSNSLKLIILQSGTVCHEEEIPSSNVALDEMPIVCTNDERLEIIACGSHTKRTNELIFVAPSDSILDSSDASILESIQIGQHRKIRFAGDIALQINRFGIDDHYFISTRQDLFDKNEVVIEGPQFDYPSDTGYPVYSGLPKIICNHPDSQVYIGDQPLGNSGNVADCWGRQVLRVKKHGKTLYRKKLAVLPSDFSLNLVAGQVPNKGTIEINGSSPFLYEVDGGVAVRTSSKPNKKCLELSAEGSPPQYVKLCIQANLLAEPINLQIPFPCKGALVFDADGNELSRNIAIDNLLGARAIFFRAPNKSATEFEIELKAPTSALGNASYVFRYIVKKAFLEVSLYDLKDKIKELLASANKSELDEFVRLIITSPSTASKQYMIGWNELTGRREGDLLVFDSQRVRQLERIKLEVINLSNPEQTPVPLTQRMFNGVPIGSFELPVSKNYPGLVIPQKNSVVQFRPLFLPPLEAPIYSENIRSMEKAAEQFHPVQNKSAFEEVFTLMANNLEHSGWRYIDRILNNYSHIPLVAFEAMKALAKNEICLALLPFATKLDIPSVMHSFQTEFNIIWELISLDHWQRGKVLYTNHASSLGLPEQLVGQLLTNKLREIGKVTSVEVGLDPDPKSKAMYPLVVNAWRDELLRSNSEVSIRWPEHYGEQIEYWVSDNHPDLMVFSVPHKFQKAVFYFPIAAAAVVADLTTWEEIFGTKNVNYFLLKQLMEFDRDWFTSVFQCSLSFFVPECE